MDELPESAPEEEDGLSEDIVEDTVQEDGDG